MLGKLESPKKLRQPDSRIFVDQFAKMVYISSIFEEYSCETGGPAKMSLCNYTIDISKRSKVVLLR
jgi:hypothetical protein